MTDPYADLRREYALGGLTEEELAADPFAMFQRWYDEATAADLYEPNAMVVASVSDDGRPSSRMVLLKGFSLEGWVFFTNLDSRKGTELRSHQECALLFPWHPLQRQVRVEGRAGPLPRSEAASYFATRPRGSQLGAWASPQSEVVTTDGLAASYAAAEARFPDEVPLPEHWGGYVVVPETIEFWQGRRNRMHDRWRYVQDGGSWRTERLAP